MTYALNNQIFMNMQMRITNTKVDVCFANCLKTTKIIYVRQVVLHLVQCIAMVAMIPLDIYVFKHSNDEVLSFFIIASCITFINLISKLSHLICRLGDAGTVMSIALELNHVVEEQPNSERLADQFDANPTFAVSEKVYNIQTNMTVDEATPAMQQMIEPALVNVIKTLALSRDPLNRCTISIGSGISFALFIYGIVILATVSEMKTGEIIVMSLFLVSQFLIQIQVFLCLIFIALLPLLCILICFYACFCKEGNKQAKLPQAVSATVEIIQKSDGSPCSICFQNIMLDEQVIILPCSDKHVFHDKCIGTWTTVKATCPICRHDLSQ